LCGAEFVTGVNDKIHQSQMAGIRTHLFTKTAKIRRRMTPPGAVFGVLAMFGTICPPGCHAQSAIERPQFEVASLKPNASGAAGFSIVPQPGGGLRANNIHLLRLIAVAYSVTDFQIFSSIKWLESDRYDLDAKSSGPAPLPQLRLMLQSLLDERFKLKIHRETRELPIYSLIPAKGGAAAPAGLVETADGDCSAANTAQAALPNGTTCGVVNIGRGWIRGQRGHISQLADRLSTLLDRTVVDKTGLAGNYNITLTWTPEPEPVRQPGDVQPANVPIGPSIFSSLEQQLGLKLVSGKGPVEVIVVDSAEKVTGN
jgi:uncharacterized protein (TIGR03435 family)